ncbi:MAG TPA: hypothetical protein VEF89_21735 [Solirubrobacteraceae bacterium]|nr:hypothetical protein [Solirubrobacteraceae bacterium]
MLIERPAASSGGRWPQSVRASASFDLAERSLEQVRRAPPAAVPGWQSQVHDERVEVVGEALGRGGEAALVELVDERLESLLGVAWVDRVITRLPVGVLDAFAFALGELGVEVVGAVNAAALAV